MIITFCGHSDHVGNAEDEKKIIAFLAEKIGDEPAELSPKVTEGLLLTRILFYNPSVTATPPHAVILECGDESREESRGASSLEDDTAG